MNSKWRVTESADGSGDPVLIAGKTDTGMVSVWMPRELTYIAPDTAERMAEAIVNAARATRRRP